MEDLPPIAVCNTLVNACYCQISGLENSVLTSFHQQHADFILQMWQTVPLEWRTARFAFIAAYAEGICERANSMTATHAELAQVPGDAWAPDRAQAQMDPIYDQYAPYAQPSIQQQQTWGTQQQMPFGLVNQQAQQPEEGPYASQPPQNATQNLGADTISRDIPGNFITSISSAQDDADAANRLRAALLEEALRTADYGADSAPDPTADPIAAAPRVPYTAADDEKIAALVYARRDSAVIYAQGLWPKDSAPHTPHQNSV